MRTREMVGCLALATLALTGCGQDAGGQKRSGAATTATATATPKATVGRLPIQPGPITPGVYGSGAFQPAFSFTLGKGWATIGREPLPVLLSILHGRRIDKGLILAVVRAARVIDPKRAYTGAQIPESAVLPPPRDLTEWLVHHPRLSATTPVSTTVGGLPAKRFDMVVRRPYRQRGCPAACVYLFAPAPNVNIQVTQGQKIRNYIVNVAGGQVAIGLLAPEKDFDRLVGEGEKAVRSIRFTSG